MTKLDVLFLGFINLALIVEVLHFSGKRPHVRWHELKLPAAPWFRLG